MSLRQITCCDQCPAEIDAAEAISNDWHSLRVKHFNDGKELTIDLCPDCFLQVTVPALLGQRVAIGQ